MDISEKKNIYIFFYAVARVNLIIFNLKIGRYIRVCVTSPIQNGRYEITSDRRVCHCARRVWRRTRAGIFELYAYTYIPHGNGNARATVPLAKYLNWTRTHLRTSLPSPVYIGPRKINLFCSSSIHTVLSYEIPLFAGGRFIWRHESSDGFVIQIEIRCVRECSLINDVMAITNTNCLPYYCINYFYIWLAEAMTEYWIRE